MSMLVIGALSESEPFNWRCWG